jgi:hypothetical protein
MRRSLLLSRRRLLRVATERSTTTKNRPFTRSRESNGRSRGSARSRGSHKSRGNSGRLHRHRPSLASLRSRSPSLTSNQRRPRRRPQPARTMTVLPADRRSRLWSGRPPLPQVVRAAIAVGKTNGLVIGYRWVGKCVSDPPPAPFRCWINPLAATSTRSNTSSKPFAPP